MLALGSAGTILNGTSAICVFDEGGAIAARENLAFLIELIHKDPQGSARLCPCGDCSGLSELYKFDVSCKIHGVFVKQDHCLLCFTNS